MPRKTRIQQQEVGARGDARRHTPRRKPKAVTDVQVPDLSAVASRRDGEGDSWIAQARAYTGDPRYPHGAIDFGERDVYAPTPVIDRPEFREFMRRTHGHMWPSTVSAGEQAFAADRFGRGMFYGQAEADMRRTTGDWRV